MVVNSSGFFLFVPIVCLLYFLLPARLRKPFLLLASYYFYMCWNAKYAVLMLLSTAVTFISGLGIERVRTERGRKLCLVLCFFVNLAILAFFKYGTFLSDNLERIFLLMGNPVKLRRFDVLLPVGISFYTFQALSYTADVFRGSIPAEHNFLHYALYVSFFPQLVAGPIERSGNLLRQIRVTQAFSWQRVRSGLQLMLWGYFEKMVLADRIAAIVDRVFASYTSYGRGALILSVFLFGIQIYCDFGGYSHIAIGAAQVLGFRLMDNFRQPYFSSSVREFWRRWHISLSSWFRDYLYIPLGGSRKGKSRQQLNLLVTFLVSGLWHGASWHYVFWGGINGILQILGERKDRLVRALNLELPEGGLFRILKTVVTTAFIMFTWLFFRAESMGQAADYLHCIISGTAPGILPEGPWITRQEVYVLLPCLLLLFSVDLFHERGGSIREALSRGYRERFLGMLLMLALVSVIYLFGAWGYGYDKAAFIYFQF